jgi:hypothetical protein
MQSRLADPELTLTMTWIWLGVLLAILAAYGVYRAWRRRHPRRPPPAVQSYSTELKQRLQKPGPRKTKRKRRGKPSRQPRRVR